jgi:hypothetical protein
MRKAPRILLVVSAVSALAGCGTTSAVRPVDAAASPTTAADSVSAHRAAPPARRSVVFRRTAGDEWKVVHWHASPAPAAPQQQSAPPSQ